MPETELDIVLRVIDNASDEFKRINQDAIKTVNELKDTQVVSNNRVNESLKEVSAKTEETTIKTKNFGEQLKETSRQARALRQSMFVVTAALAIMIKGLNDAAEYNEESKATLDAFNTSLKTLSATIGVTFAPAIQGLTFLIEGFRLTIEAALTGFVKLFSFIFEYLSQLPNAFKNIFDNIKAVFTGEDPIGIVEGFRQSFDRALEVANIAADQIAFKIESTRAKIDSGRTLKSEADQVKNEEKRKEDAKKKTAETEKQLKQQAVTDTKEMFAQLAEENKAFAIINQGIAVVESIINTAQGVTKALASANIPLAIAIGVIGAAKTALIASQKFHDGGMVGSGLRSDEVPIIAQTGEAILSRRGVASIGGESGVNRINDGGGFGGSSIEVNVYYPKMSKAEEVKELANMLGFEIEKQMQYARGI